MKINNLKFQEDMKQYKDNFFNLIFCDPPYQLGTEWIINKNTGKPIVKGKSNDFMNKWLGLNENDLDLFFKEANRIVKYGGFLLMFGLDRQLMPLEYYARLNGFKQQQSLYWYFISNFPKATDLNRMIDRKSKDSKKDYSKLKELYEGYKYGIAPFKQTNETILVFRKENKYDSIINDIISNDPECSTSALNINNSKVGDHEIKSIGGRKNSTNGVTSNYNYGLNAPSEPINKIHNGRFPPQTFLSLKTAELIDKQSGIRKSGARSSDYIRKGNNPNEIYNKYNQIPMDNAEAEEFGASKICHICDYEKEEYDIYNYNPKVGGIERNFGLELFEKKQYSCDGRKKECENAFQRNKSVSQNNHPTLKPIQLIKKIATYFKLPIEQKIYIPFCGTFSEIIGFYYAGYDEKNIYGCELSEEYIKIGNRRFEAWKENIDRKRSEDQIKRISLERNENNDKNLNDWFSKQPNKIK